LNEDELDEKLDELNELEEKLELEELKLCDDRADELDHDEELNEELELLKLEEELLLSSNALSADNRIFPFLERAFTPYSGAVITKTHSSS